MIIIIFKYDAFMYGISFQVTSLIQNCPVK